MAPYRAASPGAGLPAWAMDGQNTVPGPAAVTGWGARRVVIA